MKTGHFFRDLLIARTKLNSYSTQNTTLLKRRKGGCWGVSPHPRDKQLPLVFLTDGEL